MCRLLGVIANKPVDLQFSLLGAEKPFGDLGIENPDGWGMGWYDQGRPEVLKEPVAAGDSDRFRSIAHQKHSRIFICHVRRASRGEPAARNSHPFRYGDWIFAHNGGLGEQCVRSLQKALEPAHQAAITGDTDSEVYFHWLLQNIEDADHNIRSGIRTALEQIDDYSGLNFLLSDGHSLYAYRNASCCESYYSLFYLQRKPTRSGVFHFYQRELRTLIESKTLSGEEAVLICSEPLTEEAWTEIPLGALLVVSADLGVETVQLD